MNVLRPKIARAFLPLWSPEARHYRHLGAYGGRGSGKSWDRALAVVTRMMEGECRIACVREVQKSLKDSVHQLIVDTIGRIGVEGQFEITERAIRNTQTGASAIFLGMKDQNAEAVKSLEGVDVAWWEESQTASQRSVELLRPTVRKPGSQIWWTWNPRFRHDPVDILLRQGSAGETERLVVKANWDANPWWTEELERERRFDLVSNPQRYGHVWEGDYEIESETQFIPGHLVREARLRQPYTDAWDVCIIGVDVARFGDDRTVIFPRRGKNARSFGYVSIKGADTMQVVGRVLEVADRVSADAIFVDEGGVGSGVIDRLHQLTDIAQGVNFGWRSDHHVPGQPKAANKRAEMWAKLREDLRSGLALPDDDELEQDLTAPLYRFDANSAVQLEKKEEMRRRGIRSPDLGDALALTYAYPVVSHAHHETFPSAPDENYDPVFDYGKSFGS